MPWSALAAAHQAALDSRGPAAPATSLSGGACLVSGWSLVRPHRATLCIASTAMANVHTAHKQRSMPAAVVVSGPQPPHPSSFRAATRPAPPQNPSISYSTRPTPGKQTVASRTLAKDPSQSGDAPPYWTARSLFVPATIPPSPSFIGTAFTSKRVTVQLDKAYILGDPPQIPQNRVMLACSTHGTFDSLAIQESRCRWNPKAP